MWAFFGELFGELLKKEIPQAMTMIALLVLGSGGSQQKKPEPKQLGTLESLVGSDSNWHIITLSATALVVVGMGYYCYFNRREAVDNKKVLPVVDEDIEDIEDGGDKKVVGDQGLQPVTVVEAKTGLSVKSVNSVNSLKRVEKGGAMDSHDGGNSTEMLETFKEFMQFFMLASYKNGASSDGLGAVIDTDVSTVIKQVEVCAGESFSNCFAGILVVLGSPATLQKASKSEENRQELDAQFNEFAEMSERLFSEQPGRFEPLQQLMRQKIDDFKSVGITADAFRDITGGGESNDLDGNGKTTEGEGWLSKLVRMISSLVGDADPQSYFGGGGSLSEEKKQSGPRRPEQAVIDTEEVTVSSPWVSRSFGSHQRRRGYGVNSGLSGVSELQEEGLLPSLTDGVDLVATATGSGVTQHTLNTTEKTTEQEQPQTKTGVREMGTGPSKKLVTGEKKAESVVNGGGLPPSSTVVQGGGDFSDLAGLDALINFDDVATNGIIFYAKELCPKLKDLITNKHSSQFQQKWDDYIAIVNPGNTAKWNEINIEQCVEIIKTLVGHKDGDTLFWMHFSPRLESERKTLITKHLEFLLNVLLSKLDSVQQPEFHQSVTKLVEEIQTVDQIERLADFKDAITDVNTCMNAALQVAGGEDIIRQYLSDRQDELIGVITKIESRIATLKQHITNCRSTEDVVTVSTKISEIMDDLSTQRFRAYMQGTRGEVITQLKELPNYSGVGIPRDKKLDREIAGAFLGSVTDFQDSSLERVAELQSRCKAAQGELAKKEQQLAVKTTASSATATTVSQVGGSQVVKQSPQGNGVQDDSTTVATGNGSQGGGGKPPGSVKSQQKMPGLVHQLEKAGEVFENLNSLIPRIWKSIHSADQTRKFSALYANLETFKKRFVPMSHLVDRIGIQHAASVQDQSSSDDAMGKLLESVRSKRDKVREEFVAASSALDLRKQQFAQTTTALSDKGNGSQGGGSTVATGDGSNGSVQGGGGKEQKPKKGESAMQQVGQALQQLIGDQKVSLEERWSAYATAFGQANSDRELTQKNYIEIIQGLLTESGDYEFLSWIKVREEAKTISNLKVLAEHLQSLLKGLSAASGKESPYAAFCAQQIKILQALRDKGGKKVLSEADFISPLKTLRKELQRVAVALEEQQSAALANSDGIGGGDGTDTAPALPNVGKGGGQLPTGSGVGGGGAQNDGVTVTPLPNSSVRPASSPLGGGPQGGGGDDYSDSSSNAGSVSSDRSDESFHDSDDEDSVDGSPDPLLGELRTWLASLYIIESDVRPGVFGGVLQDLQDEGKYIGEDQLVGYFNEVTERVLQKFADDSSVSKYSKEQILTIYLLAFGLELLKVSANHRESSFSLNEEEVKALITSYYESLGHFNISAERKDSEKLLSYATNLSDKLIDYIEESDRTEEVVEKSDALLSQFPRVVSGEYGGVNDLIESFGSIYQAINKELTGLDPVADATARFNVSSKETTEIERLTRELGEFEALLHTIAQDVNGCECTFDIKQYLKPGSALTLSNMRAVNEVLTADLNQIAALNLADRSVAFTGTSEALRQRIEEAIQRAQGEGSQFTTEQRAEIAALVSRLDDLDQGMADQVDMARGFQQGIENSKRILQGEIEGITRILIKDNVFGTAGFEDDMGTAIANIIDTAYGKLGLTDVAAEGDLGAIIQARMTDNTNFVAALQDVIGTFTAVQRKIDLVRQQYSYSADIAELCGSAIALYRQVVAKIGAQCDELEDQNRKLGTLASAVPIADAAIAAQIEAVCQSTTALKGILGEDHTDTDADGFLRYLGQVSDSLARTRGALETLYESEGQNAQVASSADREILQQWRDLYFQKMGSFAGLSGLLDPAVLRVLENKIEALEENVTAMGDDPLNVGRLEANGQLLQARQALFNITHDRIVSAHKNSMLQDCLLKDITINSQAKDAILMEFAEAIGEGRGFTFDTEGFLPAGDQFLENFISYRMDGSSGKWNPIINKQAIVMYVNAYANMLQQQKKLQKLQQDYDIASADIDINEAKNKTKLFRDGLGDFNQDIAQAVFHAQRVMGVTGLNLTYENTVDQAQEGVQDAHVEPSVSRPAPQKSIRFDESQTFGRGDGNVDVNAIPDMMLNCSVLLASKLGVLLKQDFLKNDGNAESFNDLAVADIDGGAGAQWNEYVNVKLQRVAQGGCCHNLNQLISHFRKLFQSDDSKEYGRYLNENFNTVDGSSYEACTRKQKTQLITSWLTSIVDNTLRSIRSAYRLEARNPDPEKPNSDRFNNAWSLIMERGFTPAYKVNYKKNNYSGDEEITTKSVHALVTAEPDRAIEGYNNVLAVLNSEGIVGMNAVLDDEKNIMASEGHQALLNTVVTKGGLSVFGPGRGGSSSHISPLRPGGGGGSGV